MIEQIQPSYYAVIPAKVRYSKNVSDGAKLLYGEITALSNEKGYCWATNKYFAELYSKSPDTISRWISELANAEFILTLVDNKTGNSRKIWLTESQVGIGKNADGYRQKSVEGIGKNAEQNNIVNNKQKTKSSSAAKAAASDSPTGVNASNEGKKDRDAGAAIGYGFEAFWTEYDFKKGSKKNTLAKWLKLTVDEIQTIRATLEMYKRDTATDDGGRNGKNFKAMRKYPVAYINQKAWEVYAELKTEREANTAETPFDELYKKYLEWVKSYPSILSTVSYLSKDQYCALKTRKYNPSARAIGDESERNILKWAHARFEDDPLVSKAHRDVFDYHCNLINERLKARMV